MELTGRKVAFIVVGAFSIIVTVNLTLAYNAVRTFPGLEVKNSYVASQMFDERRDAQLALGWDVGAAVEGDDLILSITHADSGAPARVASLDATVGRATHVADDVTPEFVFDGTVYRAAVPLGEGNWNIRMLAVAQDGTEFRQRVPLHID